MVTRRGKQAPSDLHGNVQDQCETALLLVDVINALEFPGAHRLAKQALPAARHLAELRQRAARAGVPCIYANDNFGRWRSDFKSLVEHVRGASGAGAEIANLLAPLDQDYFVLKVKQSAFYETCLGLLLEHLGVQRLVIGGLATDNCVQLTACDAYLRGFELYVLSDGCAAESPTIHKASMDHMRRVLKAQAVRCKALHFVCAAEETRIRIDRGAT